MRCTLALAGLGLLCVSGCGGSASQDLESGSSRTQSAPATAATAPGPSGESAHAREADAILPAAAPGEVAEGLGLSQPLDEAERSGAAKRDLERATDASGREATTASETTSARSRQAEAKPRFAGDKSAAPLSRAPAPDAGRASNAVVPGLTGAAPAPLPGAPAPNRGLIAGGAPAANDQDAANESYAHVPENDYLRVKDSPLSTFSIDVDTASYANVRRFLSSYTLPPPGAVRLEELVNYFTYDYAPPKDDVPFAVHCESAQCPWNTKHHLLRIALKGKVIEKEQRPVSNLVFLLDVSGSMNRPNKLPLVKESLKMLVNELTENDRVAICVYAGAAGLVLPSTSADDKATIIGALDQLQAGGSTAGGAGIQLAYHTAVENFIKGGTNRVILCTDGDFNVGVTSQDELHTLITDSAKTGVYLSVLGFGMGNLKDSRMEMLADKGNGNYAYIDTLNEGRKVFVEQMTGTLITIAKDVKIQVDFNPAHVAAYRLLGYENRILAAQDFKDDKKDAGEIGAGHTVTALYELVPPGVEIPAGDVDPSKYQKASATEPASEHKDELLTVRLRYKEPDAEASQPLEVPVKATVQEFDQTTDDFQFATAVVQFGMLLKNSKHKGGANWDSVVEIAQGSLGKDANGYRAEFVELAKKARELATK